MEQESDLVGVRGSEGLDLTAVCQSLTAGSMWVQVHEALRVVPDPGGTAALMAVLELAQSIGGQLLWLL